LRTKAGVGGGGCADAVARENHRREALPGLAVQLRPAVQQLRDDFRVGAAERVLTQTIGRGGLRQQDVASLVDEESSCRHVTHTDVVSRRQRCDEPNAIEDRQAIDEAKDVPGQQGANTGRSTFARDDVDARHALAGRPPVHRDLQHKVVQEVHRSGRHYN
jgi:hypothetical protein